MSADEALAYGIVDKVIESRSEIEPSGDSKSGSKKK